MRLKIHPEIRIIIEPNNVPLPLLWRTQRDPNSRMEVWWSSDYYIEARGRFFITLIASGRNSPHIVSNYSQCTRIREVTSLCDGSLKTNRRRRLRLRLAQGHELCAADEDGAQDDDEVPAATTWIMLCYGWRCDRGLWKSRTQTRNSSSVIERGRNRSGIRRWCQFGHLIRRNISSLVPKVPQILDD